MESALLIISQKYELDAILSLHMFLYDIYVYMVGQYHYTPEKICNIVGDHKTFSIRKCGNFDEQNEHIQSFIQDEISGALGIMSVCRLISPKHIFHFGDLNEIQRMYQSLAKQEKHKYCAYTRDHVQIKLPFSTYSFWKSKHINHSINLHNIHSTNHISSPEQSEYDFFNICVFDSDHCMKEIFHACNLISNANVHLKIITNIIPFKLQNLSKKYNISYTSCDQITFRSNVYLCLSEIPSHDCITYMRNSIPLILSKSKCFETISKGDFVKGTSIPLSICENKYLCIYQSFPSTKYTCTFMKNLSPLKNYPVYVISDTRRNITIDHKYAFSTFQEFFKFIQNGDVFQNNIYSVVIDTEFDFLHFQSNHILQFLNSFTQYTHFEKRRYVLHDIDQFESVSTFRKGSQFRPYIRSLANCIQKAYENKYNYPIINKTRKTNFIKL